MCTSGLLENMVGPDIGGAIIIFIMNKMIEMQFSLFSIRTEISLDVARFRFTMSILESPEITRSFNSNPVANKN